MVKIGKKTHNPKIETFSNFNASHKELRQSTRSQSSLTKNKCPDDNSEHTTGSGGSKLTDIGPTPTLQKGTGQKSHTDKGSNDPKYEKVKKPL